MSAARPSVPMPGDAQLCRLAAEAPQLPSPVLIGLSGGADSVALLLIALRQGCTVQAAHLNHHLRGEDADRDEAFVRRLCAALDVPLTVGHAQPPAHPSEDWARRVRYDFFRRTMAATGCQALALAHHRDDQAETLLLHLLRGAGLTGLSGMSADAVRDGMRILRPLLGFSRQQLRAALTEAGQPWCEDATNTDARYLRNAVRTQLLPLMEQLSPGASGRIAAAAGLLQADEAALHTQAAAAAAPYIGKPWFPLDALTGLSPALQARVLRLWQQGFCEGGEILSHEQTDALLRLIDSRVSSVCNLPGRMRAYCGWQCLHLLPPQEAPAPVPVPLGPQGAALGDIRLSILPSEGSPGDGRTVQELPRQLLEGCVLRTWQPGDFIRPYGTQGRQSLQDHFTNRHVDAPFRRRIPLLCRGQEVLLCAGIGAGGVPAFDPLQDPVRLVWHGDMPWQAHHQASERR